MIRHKFFYKNIVKKFILFLSLISILSACGNIQKENNDLESKKETLENYIEESLKDKENNKYRDEILKLIDEYKIFNVKVDYKNVENNNGEFVIHTVVNNEELILKDVEKVKVFIEVQEFDKQYNIYNTNERKYWELNLENGKIKKTYNLDITKDSEYLTEEEKNLLINKYNKSIILSLKIYIDDSLPVKIYNSFLE